ncbi:uncharacterized protein A1O9_06884 [Exophiala aquamarina CBS 119918]|uniref:Uncharacterized protein n=1 Tax=Exophiala aquamarina CBS 119918 TaxID=1182545 RepID=A0A072PMF0_9EURO|nr:uncharacterized protein A1O9_06884 [Exophiala aquamarina CBS 119918]KEF56695.1 hypothetical protein A1O9_06884 [Exophiala aquamarina CBS 119918]
MAPKLLSENVTDREQSNSRPKLAIVAPSPTEGDLSNSEDRHSSKKSLKDIAKQDLNEAARSNRSMLGDPVSLKAETADRDPVKDDGLGGLTDKKKRDSKL